MALQEALHALEHSPQNTALQHSPVVTALPVISKTQPCKYSLQPCLASTALQVINAGRAAVLVGFIYITRVPCRSLELENKRSSLEQWQSSCNCGLLAHHKGAMQVIGNGKASYVAS